MGGQCPANGTLVQPRLCAKMDMTSPKKKVKQEHPNRPLVAGWRIGHKTCLPLLVQGFNFFLTSLALICYLMSKKRGFIIDSWLSWAGLRYYSVLCRYFGLTFVQWLKVKMHCPSYIVWSRQTTMISVQRHTDNLNSVAHKSMPAPRPDSSL